MTKNQSTTNYLGPFITMVFLFFVVGFLTVVNQQFQAPLKAALLSNAGNIQNTLATLITFSWFLAYPLTGGIAASLVNKHGYKGAMIRALMVMVAGLGIFEISVLQEVYAPSALSFGDVQIPVSFFIFLLGSYVVGAAVTIMQVVINPYLVACNVKGTSDVQRQNMGGSANSIGTTIAPFFVAGVIFGGAAVTSVEALIIPFIGLMVTIAIVTFIVSKLQLPNIEGTTGGEGEVLERSIWSFRHLTLGVIGIFFYVGVEVCVGANIVLFAEDLGGSFAERAATMASMYWGGMLIGRLVGSTLSKVPAKLQLTITSVAAAVLIAASMATKNPWLLVGVGLFHSIMWPAIFSLAVTGLGKYTSKGSGALMIGVVGGAILPLLQGMMADAMGWDITWALVIAGEAYLLYYALIGCKIKEQA